MELSKARSHFGGKLTRQAVQLQTKVKKSVSGIAQYYDHKERLGKKLRTKGNFRNKYAES